MPGAGDLAVSWADLDDILLADHGALESVRPCVRELIAGAASENEIAVDVVEECWLSMQEDASEPRGDGAAALLEHEVMAFVLGALGRPVTGDGGLALRVRESDLHTPWGPWLVGGYLR